MLGQGQSDSAGKKDWWHGSAMPVLHPPREGRKCMAWPAGSSTNHHGGTQYHLDVQSPGGHCFLAFSKFRDHPSVWEDLGNWCMSYLFLLLWLRMENNGVAHPERKVELLGMCTLCTILELRMHFRRLSPFCFSWMRKHMKNRHQGTGMEWLIQHGTRHGTRPTRQGMLQAFGSSWCQHHRHRGVASLGIRWLSMEAWIEPTMAINGQTKLTPVANQNRSRLMLKPDFSSNQDYSHIFVLISIHFYIISYHFNKNWNQFYSWLFKVQPSRPRKLRHFHRSPGASWGNFLATAWVGQWRRNYINIIYIYTYT